MLRSGGKIINLYSKEEGEIVWAADSPYPNITFTLLMTREVISLWIGFLKYLAEGKWEDNNQKPIHGFPKFRVMSSDVVMVEHVDGRGEDIIASGPDSRRH
jgi:hypothetical protein